MNGDKSLLAARVMDLYRRAERYEAAVGPFLTPAEQYEISHKMSLPNSEAFAVFYGGYEQSERKRLFVLPNYLASSDEPFSAAHLCEVLPEVASAVSVLRVVGSGYRKLSHRDFLGSLLALGIERDKLGDIIMMGDSQALIFCDGVLADFLCTELCRVGDDTVRTERHALPPDFTIERQYEPITGTIASVRLDGIVAELTNLSRERAQQLVDSGLVELNYETETRRDRVPTEGAVLSIRGHGKYRLVNMSSMTKKGRYRLVAEKYR